VAGPGIDEVNLPESQGEVRPLFIFLYGISIKLLLKKLQDTTTFYTFAPMKRKILTYGGYYADKQSQNR
jgi:hypothetical protein